MRSILRLVLLTVIASGCFATNESSRDQKDRDALAKTSEAILAGFAHSDVDAIMAFHHPKVEKALSYTKILIGRDAVAADLRGIFDSFEMMFIEHRVESILIEGDTAIEQTVFAVRGVPKTKGEPFVFRGRALVVYVRFKDSPTGWASIRELVQPAPSS